MAQLHDDVNREVKHLGLALFRMEHEIDGHHTTYTSALDSGRVLQPKVSGEMYGPNRNRIGGAEGDAGVCGAPE